MCIHHYGPIRRALFTGNPTRQCERCGESTMDIAAWDLLCDGARVIMTEAEYLALVDWLARENEPDAARLASIPHGAGATVEHGPYRAFLLTDEMMRTRRECEDGVRGPGKFEGEQPYAHHFYAAMMSGAGEDIYASDVDDASEDAAPIYTEFTVDPEDVELFPVLAGRDVVRFMPTDSGFWCEYTDE